MSCHASLLCIAVELAGGGYVAGTVGVAVAVGFIGFVALIRKHQEFQWSPVCKIL